MFAISNTVRNFGQKIGGLHVLVNGLGGRATRRGVRLGRVDRAGRPGRSVLLGEVWRDQTRENPSRWQNGDQAA
ncbi:hypothetical protein ABT273_30630, partial [Streptomyces humidus]|uniref:hypothetical protein n=1 Tax=Streptomyces humidus TaxID=52259 RepID=UPI0033230146